VGADIGRKIGAGISAGFTLVTGDDIDPVKLGTCYWHGFGHEGEVPADIGDQGQKMAIAPHGNPELTTAVQAPNGEYACALGMWVDERNRFAYLEPLATVPQYRRRGLAAHALIEAMKATKAMGAERCDGGADPFYDTLGFKTHLHREKWERTW
ncbi:MAG: GNAT family N-acetyltransferase, partial [Promicromonosporaceae bacterium]|nr:GNAT family N-acetyltransferase [Promicromonosporaceae bacterium]